MLGLSRSYSTSLWSCWIVCRVHGCAVKNTDCLSLLLLFPPGISPPRTMECISKTFPMWWMYSAKSSGNNILSCNDESTKISPECPWIASEVQEFLLDEKGLKQYWILFFLPPPCARECAQVLTVIAKYQLFSFNFSIKSSNLTAPSSFWGIEESCRSVLVMNFDTSKQLWSTCCGSMSIHFLTRIGTLMHDYLHSRFRLRFSLCHKFPWANEQFNVLSGYFFWRFCTYLLIPFTMRTHETVWSLSNDSFMISMQQRPSWG